MALTLTAVNLSNTQLSLDIKLDEDRAIRETLAIGGSVVLSNTSMTELDGPAGADLRTQIAAGNLRIDLSGDLPPVAFRTVLADLLAAAADDVTVSASLPYGIRILTVEMLVSTGVALATATLRDTVGGAGNALSSALDGDGTPARVLSTSDTTFALNRGDLLTLRRSNDGIIGELIVTALRTTL